MSGKDARDLAMKQLKAILYEPSLPQVEQRVLDFKTLWFRHNEGKLWEYLQKYYLQESRRRRWMKAYRQRIHYAGMDTNNYVESWHNQLKSHFLRGHNRGRGDRLIYVLSHDVDSFFQAEGMRSRVRFGRLSKGETLDVKQQKCLAGKNQDDLRAMVIHLDGKYVIRSFSVESILYNVSVENNIINGCLCTHFIKNRRPCKHMIALFYAYGHEQGLTIPSLRVLKSQTRIIARPPLDAPSADVDPFEAIEEAVVEDEHFIEVQAMRE
ncbi:hypothetical protein BGZ97_009670, partial [Linnemannia gamsii]